MIKKVVISPKNTRVIAFFEELSRKKEEMKKKLENRSALKRTGANKPKLG